MKFPLADWIDDHPDCRHNLAHSGMQGSIRAPVPTTGDLGRADPGTLRRQLADLLDTHESNVFLTHGATEANAAVLDFLAHANSGAKTCRIRRPEYPPLLDTARWFGYALTEASGPSTVALLSQPRNPEGDLWDRGRLVEWAEGADAVVIDETFREFASTPSLGDLRPKGVWRTGSFTKYYAGDSLRVGFAIAPDEAAAEFGRFHGLLVNGLPDHSVAAALHALGHRDRFRREVSAVLDANRAAWHRRLPRALVPAGPVAFDRAIPSDPEPFVERLLAASVLVCPGRLFEDPSGVRICLTRRSFPRDLDAYLAVRDGRPTATRDRSRPRVPRRPARSPPDSPARGRAGRA